MRTFYNLYVQAETIFFVSLTRALKSDETIFFSPIGWWHEKKFFVAGVAGQFSRSN